MTRSRSPSTSMTSSFALVVQFLLLCVSFQESRGFSMAPTTLYPRTADPWFRNELSAAFAASASPTRTTKPSTIRKEPVIIRDLESSEKLLGFLSTHQENNQKPAVVFYYAGWCKKCQKVGLQLQTVARKLHGSVRFASMECKPSTHDFLTETMGVQSLPNLRVYHPDGTQLVDSKSSVRNLAAELSKLLVLQNTSNRASNDHSEEPNMHEELQLSLGVATL